MSANPVPLAGGKSEKAERLISEQQQIWNEDGVWREHMAEIADITRPIRAEIRGKMTDGAKRMQRVYDSTGINAANTMAEGLYGTANNPSDIWFTIGTDDEDLNKWRGVAAYLERRSHIVLNSFGATYSAFYAETPALFLDVSAFGTGIFSSEVRANRSGFIDMARPLSECTYAVDGENRLLKMFRRWTMSCAAAHAMFGKENLSEKLQKEDNCNAPYEFLHAIVPNDLYSPGRIGANSMRFESTYAEVGEKHTISEGGFREMPYYAVRWELASGEKHGRGPGEHALPDNKSLQIQAKANLAAGELAASGPIGAPSRDALESALNWAPNKIIYGAMSEQGQQLVRRLVDQVNTPFSIEQQKALQQSIRDAFYFQMMQVQGRTGMTVLEWMDFQTERMRFLAPHLGRIQTDFHAPLVMRRMAMLERAVPGIFGPMPAALQGKTLKPIFVSPLALAQKSQRAASALRAVQSIGAVAQVDPKAADRLNGDKAAQLIAEGSGVPEILNDDDTTAANTQSRVQAQQAAAMGQIAQPLADAANKGASALATFQGATQPKAAA